MSRHFISANVNTSRGALRSLPKEIKRAEARKSVKMFLGPRDPSPPITDSMIPDFLVTDQMIDRYLSIEPPSFRVMPDFDRIIDEIEQSYVTGLYFSALSASLVSIERLLNDARIRVHPFAKQKLKTLQDKGPINNWCPNIEALEKWKYLSPGQANELKKLYKLRCDYLHSQPVTELEKDALRSVSAAYKLIESIIGFPSTLFRLNRGRFECLDVDDPLVKAFYNIKDKPNSPSRPVEL